MTCVDTYALRERVGVRVLRIVFFPLTRATRDLSNKGEVKKLTTGLTSVPLGLSHFHHLPARYKSGAPNKMSAANISAGVESAEALQGACEAGC